MKLKKQLEINMNASSNSQDGQDRDQRARSRSLSAEKRGTLLAPSSSSSSTSSASSDSKTSKRTVIKPAAGNPSGVDNSNLINTVAPPRRQAGPQRATKSDDITYKLNDQKMTQVEKDTLKALSTPFTINNQIMKKAENGPVKPHEQINFGINEKLKAPGLKRETRHHPKNPPATGGLFGEPPATGGPRLFGELSGFKGISPPLFNSTGLSADNVRVSTSSANASNILTGPSAASNYRGNLSADIIDQQQDLLAFNLAEEARTAALKA